MAGADHTCIIFKNGNYIPTEQTYDYNEETDEIISHLPFEYGRDGDIRYVNSIPIWDQLKWYHDEYDAIYERDGWRDFSSVRKTPYGLWAWLKYKLHFMSRICYRQETAIWRKDKHDVYIYHDALNQSYISFYTDGVDSYVVIGGYGHHKNVYTHFMARGYGDEFEQKMAEEAFWWACNNILVKLVEVYCPGYWYEQEDEYNKLRAIFMPKEIYQERYPWGFWPKDLWKEGLD